MNPDDASQAVRAASEAHVIAVLNTQSESVALAQLRHACGLGDTASVLRNLGDTLRRLEMQGRVVSVETPSHGVLWAITTHERMCWQLAALSAQLTAIQSLLQEAK